MPPKGGVAIRMYRIGHGDCFLLAFSGKEKPIFVLIDCGYKPGSPKFINDITTPDKVVADIKAVTGGHIDVAVITHEHQDHVNAITRSRFDGFTMARPGSRGPKARTTSWRNVCEKIMVIASRRWLPQASGLLQPTRQLALKMNEYIALAVGGEQPAGSGIPNAFSAVGSWTNKDAMKLFRDLSQSEVKCLYPHKEIIKLPGAESVRVFALGPPYDETALKDLDPHDGEGFPQQGRSHGWIIGIVRLCGR